MAGTSLLRKDQLEQSLRQEKQLIADGKIKEDNPLDRSEAFKAFCMACRRGDLRMCREMIAEGSVNINARDDFDYTPLILVSLLSCDCVCNFSLLLVDFFLIPSPFLFF